jgi:hypothetical protein
METQYFKIMNSRIIFNRGNEHLLPPKPRLTLRHLKKGYSSFSLIICFGDSGQGG